MGNIAIIPARSGSKGLKDKNIKDLHGKPLLAYAIIAAQESKLFDEIYVSTDSEIYAEIARNWGASVPFLRSSELATDIASTWDVVKAAIATYRERNKMFDSVALLQPTSPNRTAEDIIRGYKMFEELKANTVVSVCELDHSPLWSNSLPQDHSFVNFINKELVNTPRQKLPVYYRVNGALYIVKTDYLMEAVDLYAEKSYAIVMTKEHSIDIDDQLDFIIAETVMGYGNEFMK